MNQKLIATALFLLSISATKAQETQDTLVVSDDNQMLTELFNSSSLEGIDYSEFKLPPLGILFENAKTSPSIELLEKERQMAEKLLTKEKCAFLNFFRVHANYSYGNTSSTSTSTDITTPLYTFASGYESSYWNVGASVNVGLESLMDLPGRISRQRLEVEKAAVNKEIAYDELRQKIATIYVRVTNKLAILKTAAENAAAYRGAGLMMEQRFRNNQATIQDLADVRRYESDAVQSFQTIQSEISTDIILLEILTHTPIITNTISEN